MTLVEKVLNFEEEVSFDIPEFVENDIKKLEKLEDVRKYYLYERGWKGDSSLEDLLFDLIFDLSTSTPTQN
jgi:hypothetical protein